MRPGSLMVHEHIVTCLRKFPITSFSFLLLCYFSFLAPFPFFLLFLFHSMLLSLSLPSPSPTPHSTIHVDCITVSTLPVKSAIDDHIQQLFDALLSSLRRSISTNLQVYRHHTDGLLQYTDTILMVYYSIQTPYWRFTAVYRHHILTVYCSIHTPYTDGLVCYNRETVTSFPDLERLLLVVWNLCRFRAVNDECTDLGTRLEKHCAELTVEGELHVASHNPF